MIAVIIAWVIGIGCIFLMKKIQPGGWIAYAIYVLVVFFLPQLKSFELELMMIIKKSCKNGRNDCSNCNDYGDRDC